MFRVRFRVRFTFRFRLRVMFRVRFRVRFEHRIRLRISVGSFASSLELLGFFTLVFEASKVLWLKIVG